MQRLIKYAFCILCLVLCVRLFLKGSVPQVLSGMWHSTGSMTEPRAAASAALLQDGRVLITGGEGASGALVSAELFDAGSFSAATPMDVARSRHTSLVLQDGRVLVAGGTTTGGGATNAAEIYSPESNSWSTINGGMTEARSGHTASLLPDGRVLMTGGESSGVASSTLEVFNPVSNTFAFAGVLSSPRTSHAAAVLSDGRVLIAGGSSGSAAMNTVDIYDPQTGAISQATNLSTPRTGLSATTLLDGKVLLAGGNDGANDLASAEVYDPTAGTLSPAASALATPRKGHLAFLLPHNNSVLIVGGTSAGAELSSAELFIPWAGTFNSTGSPAAARTRATGSSLSFDGLFLLAGGENVSGKLSSTELYGFATVKTDKEDYAPGETVTITGRGWQPGETVTLTFLESPNLDTHGPFSAVADSSGNIHNNLFAPDEHDINVLFYVTATGSVSQAQTTFTDGPKVGSVTVGSQTGTLTAGTAGSATYIITVIRGSGSGAFDAALSPTTALPTGASASFSAGSLASCASGGQKTCFNSATNEIRFASSDNSLSASLTISTTAATPSGTTSFTVRASTSTSDFADGNGSLVVAAAKASTNLAVASATGPFGGTVNLSATLTSGGSPLAGKTVNFTLNGTGVGSASTNASGVATLSNISLGSINAGTYPTGVGASFAGDSSFTASSGSNSLTVSQATQTIAFGALSNKTYGDALFTVSATGGASGNPVTFTASPAGVCTSGGTNGSTITITGAGSCTVTAHQGGNSNYSAAADLPQSFIVNKATPTVAVGFAASPITYDGNAHPAAATVTGVSGALAVPANGTVTISYKKGGVAFAGTPTDAASYTASAHFASTNANYNDADSTADASLTINKATATITLGNLSQTYDGTPKSATATTTPPGLTVNFTYTQNGNPVASPTNAGSYTVVATVQDNNYQGSASGTLNINKANSSISVGSTPNPSFAFQNVTVTALLAPATATGTAQFFDSGNPLGSPVSISGGAASLVTAALAPGSHQITASYLGDNNFNGSTTATAITQVVNQIPTTAALASSNTSVLNTDSITVTTTINPPGATGNVQFYDGNNALGSPAALSNGVAVATLSAGTLSIGTHTITAVYGGDAAHLSSTSAPVTQTINNTPTGSDVAVQPYDFSANNTVTADSVTFHNVSLIGITSIETKSTTDQNFPLLPSNFHPGVPGNFFNLTTTATFTGSIQVCLSYLNVTYTHPSTITLLRYNTVKNEWEPTTNQTVDQSDPNNPTVCGTATSLGSFIIVEDSSTKTDLSSSPNPSTYGQSVTLTATITPSTATGSVEFLDGNTSLGTANVSNGIATFITSSTQLHGGNHTIKAVYTDPGNYFGSSSATISHTVNKADSTTTVTVAGGVSFTYDGNMHPATVTVTGAGGLNLTPAPDYSCGHAPKDVADSGCIASYNFAGDDDHKPSSDSKTYTISKADPVVTATGGTVTYDGNPHGGSGSAKGVKNEDLTPVTVAYKDGLGNLLASAPVNAGTYSVAARYAGDANYNQKQSAAAPLTINKADSSTLVTVAGGVSFTYDGNEHPATVAVTGAGGLNLNPTPVYSCGHVPINVADSGCTAIYNFAGDPNHNGSSDSKTYTISKADPVVTATGGTVTYDGNPHGGSGSAKGVKNEDLTPVTVAYKDGLNNLLTSAPVNAGTYSVAARYAGDANYNQKQSAAAPLTINKADSSTLVTVAGGVSFTYDGNEHPAMVAVTGAGGLNLTPAPDYSCGHAPINVADSGCAASYSFAGDPNHNGSSDSKTYTISKADPVVTATGGTVTYDDNPHGGSGSAKGVKNEDLTPVTVAYKDALNNLLTSAPVNAGSYQVAARYAGDANYNQKQSAAAPLTINKADSSTLVTVAGGMSFTYDGNEHPATVAVTGAGGLNLAPAPDYSCGHAPINVADSGCTASYNFAGDPNHNGSSDSKTYTISKADPVVTATGGTVTYDDNPHGGSGSAKGVKNEDLTPVTVAYKDGLGNLLASAPVNAGTYSVATRYAGDANYNPKQSAAAPLTINQADSSTLVTVAGGESFTYDGNAHPATVAATGVGGLNLNPTPVYSCGHAPINVADSGCTASYSFAGDANHKSSSDTKTYTINHATPTVTVSGGPFNHDGNPHPATVAATGIGGVTVPGSFSVTYTPGGSTAPTNAGTYPVSASFISSDPNYASAIGSGSIKINQATPTVTVSGGPFIYDSQAHAAIATATGVGGAGVSGTFSFTYNPGGTTMPVNAGTYGVTASFTSNNPNYTNGSGTGSIIISAAPTITTLSSSLSQSKTPVSITLTATVTSATVAPIGTLTVTDTSTNKTLGTLNLAGGPAILTLTTDSVSLGVGTHAIVATYTPNTNFMASSSSNTIPVVTITGPASGSVQAVNTTFSFSATVADPDTSSPSAQWSFDTTASTNGTVNMTGGTITGSFAFSAADVSNITLTFTDGLGGIVIANTVNSAGAPSNLPATVVVFDPSAGFVTGGGWINSPAGAYVSNPTLTGKASFGFVSKYQKGATVPTGETEFNYQVANFNFHSTSYQWLVVSGSQAQYKGSGTINGSGNYNFLLTALDGNPDGFRIKITDSSSTTLIYDNRIGSDDNVNNTQPIGGGSVVIHK